MGKDGTTYCTVVIQAKLDEPFSIVIPIATMLCNAVAFCYCRTTVAIFCSYSSAHLPVI